MARSMYLDEGIVHRHADNLIHALTFETVRGGNVSCVEIKQQNNDSQCWQPQLNPDSIHTRRTRQVRLGAAGRKSTRETKEHDLLAIEKVNCLDGAARGTFKQCALCRS